MTIDSGDTEKTLLVGAPLKVLKKRDAENHLLELADLVVSAGGTVVGIESQRISRPNPRFLIGKGKLQELVEIVKSTGANLVIFDDELTPLQGKSIEAVSYTHLTLPTTPYV